MCKIYIYIKDLQLLCSFSLSNFYIITQLYVQLEVDVGLQAADHILFFICYSSFPCCQHIVKGISADTCSGRDKKNHQFGLTNT